MEREGPPPLTPEERDRLEGVDESFHEAAKRNLLPSWEESLQELELYATDTLPERETTANPKEKRGVQDSRYVDVVERNRQLAQETVALHLQILEILKSRGDLIPSDYKEQFHHVGETYHFLKGEYLRSADEGRKKELLSIMNTLLEVQKSFLRTIIDTVQRRKAGVVESSEGSSSSRDNAALEKYEKEKRLETLLQQSKELHKKAERLLTEIPQYIDTHQDRIQEADLNELSLIVNQYNQANQKWRLVAALPIGSTDERLQIVQEIVQNEEAVLIILDSKYKEIWERNRRQRPVL